MLARMLKFCRRLPSLETFRCVGFLESFTVKLDWLLGQSRSRQGRGSKMQRTLQWSVALSMCAVGMVTPSQAGVILAYETGNPEGGLAATEVALGVIPMDLSRGSGIERASGGTFNSRGWTTDLLPASQDYIEWGWSASAQKWDLDRLEVRYDRSSSGPAQLEIQLAVNGGEFTSVFSDADVNTAGESQLAIDLSSLDQVESASMRLFGFAAVSESGTFDLENFQGSPNRSIAVHGTLSNQGGTAVPEPDTVALFGLSLGCVGLVPLCRRGRHRGRVMPGRERLGRGEDRRYRNEHVWPLPCSDGQMVTPWWAN